MTGRFHFFLLMVDSTQTENVRALLDSLLLKDKRKICQRPGNLYFAASPLSRKNMKLVFPCLSGYS